jgi:hypothetical protein
VEAERGTRVESSSGARIEGLEKGSFDLATSRTSVLSTTGCRISGKPTALLESGICERLWVWTDGGSSNG